MLKGASSLRGENGNYQVTVQTILVDDLLEVFDAPEAVIKIDIESSECKALEGSLRFFEKVKVQAVFMEWFHLAEFLGRQDEDEYCVLDMVRRLRKYGLLPYGLHTQFDFEDKTESPLADEDINSWPMDLVWRHPF